ncbi:MAG: hypothetical protein M9897_11870 [Brumimicrobium sp.]|nr:hypothetical protein [Brumimicrobium sp.]
MDRFKIILILFVFCNPITFSQDKMDGGEIKHYFSDSKMLKNIVNIYLDSTYNRLGCTNTDKLSIIQRTGFDSIKKYYYYEIDNIQNMPFYTNNYFKELEDMGNVVVTVDSINIFIREEVLKDLPFRDSIHYVGEKNIILKYGKVFELCQPGSFDFLRFLFLPDGKVDKNYICLMPLKSSDKNKKRKLKARKNNQK